MRRAVPLCLCLLASCTESEALPVGAAIECALDGAAGFAAVCSMERQDRDGQRLLVVRHPDGGFRRFELGVPERGMITADGMEQAIVERGDGLVEVRVGADRYRLPVTE